MLRELSDNYHDNLYQPSFNVSIAKIAGIRIRCISFVAKNCEKCDILARIIRLACCNMTFFVYICRQIAKEQIHPDDYAHYHTKNQAKSLHRGVVRR